MDTIQMPIDVARVVLDGYTDVDGTQGVFPFLQRIFGFQADSVSNMHESLTFTLATHISRTGDPDEEDRGVPKAPVIAAVVANYRNELMRNQGLWFTRMGLTDPAKRWPLSDTDKATMEVALVHLIWAEAANLRFCPEFLCFVYYHLSTAVGRHLRSITALPAGSGAANASGAGAAAADGQQEEEKGSWTYLEKVVRPNYLRLVKDTRPGLDHIHVRNYDDFNEFFWGTECLTPESKHLIILGWFDEDDADHGHALNASSSEDDALALPDYHEKTFLEIRSYMALVNSFWRILFFHVMTFHALCLLAAKWDDGFGNATDVMKTIDPVAVTLAGLSLALELVNLIVGSEWRLAFYRLASCKSDTAKSLPEAPALRRDQAHAARGGGYEPLIKASASRRVGARGRSRRSLAASASIRCQALLTLIVLAVRTALKVALVYVTATGTSDVRMAYLAFGLAIEVMASMGLNRFLGQHCGTPGRLLNLCLGASTANIYTQPGVRKLSWSSVFAYTSLWITVFAAKILIDFFLVMKPVVSVSQKLFDNTTYYRNLLIDHDANDDESNSMLGDLEPTTLVALVLVGPLWVNVISFYVIDLEVYFVFAINVVSAFRGIWIGVGSRLTAATVEADLGLLSGLPSKLNLPRGPSTRSGRRRGGGGGVALETTDLSRPLMGPGTVFGNVVPWAKLWNEIISTMRLEDELTYEEADDLSYVILQRQPLETPSHPGLVVPNRVIKPPFVQCGKLGRLLKHVEKYTSGAAARIDPNFERHASPSAAKAAQLAAIRDRPEVVEQYAPALLDFLTVVEWLLVGRVREESLLVPMLTVLEETRKFWGDAQTAHDTAVMSESLYRLAAELTWLPGLGRLVHAAVACLTCEPPAASAGANASAAPAPLEKDVPSANDTELYTELVVALHGLLKPAASRDIARSPGGRSGRHGGGGSSDAGLESLRNAAQAFSVALEQVVTGLEDGVPITISPDAPATHPRTMARARLEKVVANLLRKTKSGTQNLPPSIWRRITFFCSSLDMPMPTFVRTDQIRSWGTLTPYYSEDVIFSMNYLYSRTAQGVTTLEYLKTLNEREWTAFLERVCRNLYVITSGVDKKMTFEKAIKQSTSKSSLGGAVLDSPASGSRAVSTNSTDALDVGYDLDGFEPAAFIRTTLDHWSGFADDADPTRFERGASGMPNAPAETYLMNELRLWASYRGQTLSRTVRGIMYYDRAIQCTKLLEVEEQQNASQIASVGAGGAVASGGEGGGLEQDTFSHRPRGWGEETTRAKYSYVITAQIYGAMAKSSKPDDLQKARDIDRLLMMNPNLRVAFIDHDKPSRRYWSVLIRYDTDSGGIVEVYRVELPGDPVGGKGMVGEKKPNNQNHALPFTRGCAVQAVDMNMDSTFEDAIKMRCLQESFEDPEGSKRGIAGCREHVFTDNVSSLANFMAVQELSFVTATQRVLHEPLNTRFHYGHPDLFDKVSVMTLGGMSKASAGINLSEDIFAGFSYVQRGQNSTQADYVQLGKGKDVGFSQIASFNAKIAMGNAEQCLSRDVYRLAQGFDYFRTFSLYYSSVGGFVAQLIVVLCVFVVVYCKVFLAMSGSVDALSGEDDKVLKSIYEAFTSTYIVQMYFLQLLAMLLVLAVENGTGRGLQEMGGMLIRGSMLFYGFQVGTKSYYLNSVLTFGNAAYIATGRGFVINHDPLTSIFRNFMYSHLMPGTELMVLLITGFAYRESGSAGSEYVLQNLAFMLLGLAYLLPPFLYNPNGLDYGSISRGFDEWSAWMSSRDMDKGASWEAWWREQTEPMRTATTSARCFLFFFKLRFLALALSFTYVGSNESHDSGMKSWTFLFVLFGIVTWLVVLAALAASFMHRSGKSNGVGTNGYKHLSRLRCRRVTKAASLCLVIGAITFLLAYPVLTVGELCNLVCAAIVMAHWLADGLALTITNTFIVGHRDLTKFAVVRVVNQFYHGIIGGLIFIPILVLSSIPFISTIQTRILFNNDFSERLAIAQVFSKQDERKKQI